MLPRMIPIATAILTVIEICTCANILMITMGGTKSHKIPFWELARGLIPRGHNITFISAFPSDFIMPGLEEITPADFVFYVKNFTDWDLVGAKMRDEFPVHPIDILRYGYESCDVLLSDPETREFIYSKQKFDLLILDGAYPECALGFVKAFNVPFMYINTVGFYTGSLSLAGNPAPYSVTPFFALPFTDNMNLLQRTANSVGTVLANVMHVFLTKVMIQPILRRHFGRDMPPIYELSSNVSFILQNGHATVTYPRPYLPNVAEIACIHCKKAKALPDDLEDFIRGSGEAGFIYFSMGSSVKAANMPEFLRRMLLRVFRQLPQRVLWKYEAEDMHDLPSNVKLGRWLPQQDILAGDGWIVKSTRCQQQGHPKIRAFVTHGGLLSMFETVYHGVPIVTLPVFCDHDSNAAKAEIDGYAVKLELPSLTADSLLWAIKKVIYDPKYKEEVKKRQFLLRDQKETALDRAVYWTEYVLRHRGAKHLQSPAKNLGYVQYYLIDVIIVLVLFSVVLWYCLKFFFSLFVKGLTGLSFSRHRKDIKIE